MGNYDPLCHCVSARVDVAAESAFRYLSDPHKLGRWALGCFNTKPTDRKGVFRGTSLFDGSTAWFHIETDEERSIIDYHVGGPEQRAARISTRIVPGPVWGGTAEQCIVSMTAWRLEEMSEERWQRLCATHDTEILLIQSQLM